MVSAIQIENYHHGDLRWALIDAALAALAENSPGTLSLRGLARATGVSATAVYRHFADKEDLLAAIATEGFEGLSASMQQRLTQEPDAGRLRRLVILGEGYVDYAIAHPAHYRLMFGPRMLSRSRHPALATAAAQSYGMLEQAVSDAITAGELPAMPEPVLSTLFWSWVHGLAMLNNDGLLAHPELPGADELSHDFGELLASALNQFKPTE